MLIDERRHKRRQINDACHPFDVRRICIFGSIPHCGEHADADFGFLGNDRPV